MVLARDIAFELLISDGRSQLWMCLGTLMDKEGDMTSRGEKSYMLAEQIPQAL